MGPFRSHLGSKRGSWALRGAPGALLGTLGLLLGTLGAQRESLKSKKLVFLATVVIFKGPLGTPGYPTEKVGVRAAALLRPRVFRVLLDKS